MWLTIRSVIRFASVAMSRAEAHVGKVLTFTMGEDGDQLQNGFILPC